MINFLLLVFFFPFSFSFSSDNQAAFIAFLQGKVGLTTFSSLFTA